MTPISITIQRESVMTTWRETLPLYRRHWEEMPHQPGLEFFVNIPAYERAELGGMLRFYTARCSEILVGYGVFFLHDSLWYRDTIEAGQHSLYLAPEARQGWNGIKLIRFTEDALRAEGVRILHQHVHGGGSEARLFPLLGYTKMHEEFEKRLDLPASKGV